MGESSHRGSASRKRRSRVTCEERWIKMICILISSCSRRISSHAFRAASLVETNMSPEIPSRFSSSIISLNSAHHASTPSYIMRSRGECRQRKEKRKGGREEGYICTCPYCL